MDQEQRVDAALFQHLIANSTIPLIGSGLGGALVAAAQSQSPESHLVVPWLAFLYSTLLVRVWLTRRIQARLAVTGFVRAEAIRHALTTSLSGLAWGAAGVLFTSMDPIAMVVTISAVQAMVMGGALTLGAFMPSFLAFSLPAILPMIVVLALGGSIANVVLAAYSLIFLILMLGIAKRFNRSLRQTWKLTFEKEDLLKALTEAHQQQSLLAQTDGLTGIANRRRFDEILDTELARLQRSLAPLSLIILDVDHFKAFNDTYGHVAGDLCLKQVAGIFQTHLNRAPDLAARFGGEEFAGILPETDHAGAVAIAERIRADVIDLKVKHDQSQTHEHVTVSLGVVTLDCSRIESSDEAVSLADRQLYRAKAEGRNRVAAWSNLEAASPVMQ